MRGGRYIGLAALCSLTSPILAAEPWQLDAALGTPGWLTVGGSYRVRYESLDNPFRIGSDGSDELLVERLLLDARGEGSRYLAGIEIEDSRAQLADARTPLGTDDVNTLEPLRLYAGLRLDDVFREGDRLDLVVGRLTIDAGSRRLVARNRFRNTLNAFTGVHGAWSNGAGADAQAFMVLPVHREPQLPDELRDNEFELDDESRDVRLAGLFASRSDVLAGAALELYAYVLNEDDAPGLPTANRDLFTPGLRLFRRPSADSWDFEVEAALQTGTSHETILPADTTELDHRAGFVHLHLGRTLAGPWSPRIVLQYDYASGDDSPDDLENNRFDTLYGARRFDFGPTGIYGALARANISSPGLRVDLTPGEHSDLFAGYRAVFLASDTDALTTAGLRDPSGGSGSFVGHQLEVLFRHLVVPGNLEVQLGGAWLVDGEFLEDAPGAPPTGDSLYLFAEGSVFF